jgi:hypothetical protein
MRKKAALSPPSRGKNGHEGASPLGQDGHAGQGGERVARCNGLLHSMVSLGLTHIAVGKRPHDRGRVEEQRHLLCQLAPLAKPLFGADVILKQE